MVSDQEIGRQKIDKILKKLEGAIDFDGNGAELLHQVRKELRQS